jgi:hypothetical protein
MLQSGGTLWRGLGCGIFENQNYFQNFALGLDCAQRKTLTEEFCSATAILALSNRFFVSAVSLALLQSLRPELETRQKPTGLGLAEGEIAGLRERLAVLTELVGDLRAERDRLSRIIEEQAGSVRLLTDQRSPPKGFWRRFFMK